MPTVPETQYAVTDDGVHIAYQVFGEGDDDLVVIPGFVSNVEVAWEFPPWADLLRRFGSFARVVTLDKRGTGLSDRTTELPDVDRRMLDVLAVMEAAGSQSATLLGISEGAAMALTFAATHPERTKALAVFGGYALLVRRPDHPIGVEPGVIEAFGADCEAKWGTGVGLAGWAPSIARDPDARALFGRFQRLGASPSAARQLLTSLDHLDARPALPLIDTPTVVLHRSGDLMVPVEVGREIADGIDGARFVELDGADHLFGIGDNDRLVDEISTLVTGAAMPGEPDRVLATVLFTDIVDSTGQATAAGDARWRATLDAHDRFVEDNVVRHGGRLVKHTGDGALAVFDGPTRAARCAARIAGGAREVGVSVRAGLHTGEVVQRGDDVSGIAVHLAARVAGAAEGDEVLVSRTLVDLVAGSGLSFTDRGEHHLKGVDGAWRLYALDGGV